MIGPLQYNDGMYAIYHLDDELDDGPNGYDLSISETVTFEDFGYGTSAYFDDPNAGMLYRNDLIGMSDLTGDFTIMGSAYSETLGTDVATSNPIFEIADDVSNISIKLRAYHSNATGYTVFCLGPENAYNSASFRSDLRNNWFRWAVVQEASSGNATLYINGIELITISSVDPVGVSNFGLSIGRDIIESVGWNGYIDEVAILDGLMTRPDLSRWNLWCSGLLS